MFFSFFFFFALKLAISRRYAEGKIHEGMKERRECYHIPFDITVYKTNFQLENMNNGEYLSINPKILK